MIEEEHVVGLARQNRVDVLYRAPSSFVTPWATPQSTTVPVPFVEQLGACNYFLAPQ